MNTETTMLPSHVFYNVDYKRCTGLGSNLIRRGMMIAEPGLGVPGAIAGTMSQYRLDARRQAEKYRRTRACTVARPYSEGISVGGTGKTLPEEVRG